MNGIHVELQIQLLLKINNYEIHGYSAKRFLYVRSDYWVRFEKQTTAGECGGRLKITRRASRIRARAPIIIKMVNKHENLTALHNIMGMQQDRGGVVRS